MFGIRMNVAGLASDPITKGTARSPLDGGALARLLIDTSFDFRTDASGKAPDAHSPTLRQYHELLWNKALPSGRLFDLDDTVRGVYLHHGSELGEFFLCSNSVIKTLTVLLYLFTLYDK
jgi:hypothetical protein